MTTPLPPAVDYSSRDYTALLASMFEQATTITPEWTSRSPADFGVVMLELFAWVGDNLSYSIDRAASEAFLATAAQRSSVLAHAALMGYKPQAAGPATVELTFTVVGTATVDIPAGTQVSTVPDVNVAAVVFETDTDLSFTAGALAQQSGVVSATQGVTVANESVGVSTGGVGQQFVLSQTPVVASSISVVVQDDPSRTPRTWAQIDNMIEAASDAEVFATDTTDNGQTLILFGNGVTGKVPVRGATIVATYRVGGGVVGNVSALTLTQMITPVGNVISVTNGAGASGGQDVEGIESIRANAPAVFRASNRAVTTQDHADLALRVPGVSAAAALSSVYTSVTVFVAPVGGGLPTASLLSSVASFVQARAMAGVSVRAAQVGYVPVNVTGTIEVYEQYDRESVRVAALAALASALAYGNVGFGVTISQAGVYAVLMSTEGVAAVTLTLLSTSGSGLSDIDVEPWQIATAGALQLGATGGIVAGDSTLDVFGNVPTMPTPVAAPGVFAINTGATVNMQVTWDTTAPNQNLWYVEVIYKDGSGDVLDDVIVGSFTSQPQTFDVGLNGSATALDVRILSYNGVTGPVDSAVTTVAYPS